ncbi:MAG: RNA polymerase sigma factor [Acidobacteria bacterium]|nr:RNA polymerase sigma factor [Acidobacteriota bacterium]
MPPADQPLEDAQVVKLVLKGRREMFGVLLERYQRPIFNFVYRFYGNYDLAQELTQETFLRCYQFLKSYDPKRKFSTWLYTVAKNLCIDELKKRKSANEVALDDAMTAVEAKGAEGMAERSAQLQCIRREDDFRLLEALQELPADARTVLLLHYFQGLSYQEIGESLSLPVSTVKIRIFRAKKVLLEKWKELGGEGEAPIGEEG